MSGTIRAERSNKVERSCVSLQFEHSDECKIVPTFKLEGR